jgi:hypothetical protein
VGGGHDPARMTLEKTHYFLGHVKGAMERLTASYAKGAKAYDLQQVCIRDQQLSATICTSGISTGFSVYHLLVFT